jgi:hypothetical protein
MNVDRRADVGAAFPPRKGALHYSWIGHTLGEMV